MSWLTPTSTPTSISKITSCGGEALLIPKFIEKYGDKGGIKLIEG